MGRFSVPVAVVVLIIMEDDGRREVLLQRRQNTGFGDGMWDFACSGHVEEGESLTSACVRECREELGIVCRQEDLNLFTIIYKRDGELTYLNPYFELKKFCGTPDIKEPVKCSELRWFPFDCLPENLLPDRREALDAFINGVPLIEYGWDKKIKCPL